MNATMIGQLGTLIVLVWFLNRFLWGPITSALEERRKRIADGLAAAERGHHEKALAEKQAKETLHEGKEQAAEIVAQAQRRADDIIEKAKADARVEGNRLIEAAKAEIDQQTNQAKEQLRAEVVRLALAGAEQVLMREVDAPANDEVLKKLAAQL